MHFPFYIQSLYKARYFVNDVIVGKTGFISHVKPIAEATQWSISLMRDNIKPWILEQRRESIPWYSEIQNQHLRIPLNFIPILHGAQDEWSLNQFVYVDFPLEKCISKILYRKTVSSSFNHTFILIALAITLFNNSY